MIHCSPYSCSMMASACRTNRATAEATLTSIIRGGETIFTSPEYAVNRMLVCGSCPKSSIDSSLVKSVFRDGMERLVHRISAYNEWGPDPDRSRIKTFLRGKKWREENQDRIKEAGIRRRTNKRLEELRRDYGIINKNKGGTGKGNEDEDEVQGTGE